MVDRITINFTANTREVERGAERMSDALGDVEGSLEDVGQKGEEALGQAGDAVDDLDGKTRNAQGTVQELGTAAKQALSGDFVGGASSAGLALAGLAGVGGTVAIGLIEIAKGFAAAWQENAKATEERVKSMYADMLESGQNFLSESKVQTKINDIVNDTEKIKDLNGFAIESGISIAELVAAEAGASEARQAVLAELNAQIAENLSLQASTTDTSGNELIILEAKEVKLQAILSHYGELNAEQSKAYDLAQLGREAQDVAAIGTAEEVLRRREENELVQKRNKALADTPTTVTTKLVLDTKQAEADLRALATKTLGITVVVKDPIGRRIP